MMSKLFLQYNDDKTNEVKRESNNINNTINNNKRLGSAHAFSNLKFRQTKFFTKAFEKSNFWMK